MDNNIAHELVQANVAEFERLAARLHLESEAKAGLPKRQFLCIPWPRHLRLPRSYGQNQTRAAH